MADEDDTGFRRIEPYDAVPAVRDRTDDGLEPLAHPRGAAWLLGPRPARGSALTPAHFWIWRSVSERVGTLPIRNSEGRTQAPSRSSRSRATSEERSW